MQSEGLYVLHARCMRAVQCMCAGLPGRSVCFRILSKFACIANWLERVADGPAIIVTSKSCGCMADAHILTGSVWGIVTSLSPSLPAESVFAPLPRTQRGMPLVLHGDPKGKNFLYTVGSGVIIRDIEVRGVECAVCMVLRVLPSLLAVCMVQRVFPSLGSQFPRCHWHSICCTRMWMLAT